MSLTQFDDGRIYMGRMSLTECDFVLVTLPLCSTLLHNSSLGCGLSRIMFYDVQVKFYHYVLDDCA
jgi:hypothetical protein